MIQGINGVHHVAITVPDIDQALAFYNGVLGFELVTRVDWSSKSADQTNAGGPISSEILMTHLRNLHHLDGFDDLEGSIALLRVGNTNIELFDFRSPPSLPQDNAAPTRQCGLMHIGFDVTDVEDLYRRLSHAGVRFHAPPQRGGAAITTYGRDPFGNILEFQQLTTNSTLPRIRAD